MQAIVAALTNIGAMSMVEIMAHTDRSKTAARNSLALLRAKRLVHIAYYEDPVYRGRRVPMYAVGDRDDAREWAVPAAERDAKYRENNLTLVRARDRARRGSVSTPWDGLRA